MDHQEAQVSSTDGRVGEPLLRLASPAQNKLVERQSHEVLWTSESRLGKKPWLEIGFNRTGTLCLFFNK